MLDAIAQWWRNRSAPAAPPPARFVELHDEGFDFVDPGGVRHHVLWSSVTAIATYKYDLCSVDAIVLAFEVDGHPGVVIEASEDGPGFSKLFEPLEKHFGLNSQWYRDVMIPAFATNYRELYRRTPPVSNGGATLTVPGS